MNREKTETCSTGAWGSNMMDSGEIMEKETEAGLEAAVNQPKSFERKNRIDTKELNIGDGWSIRVEKRNGNSDSVRLRS